MFEKKIVLYGAGITGIETQKALINYFRGIEILCFCDSRKHGSLGGLPIISPEQLELIGSAGEIVIIVTALANNYDEIIRNLHALRLPLDCIYTLGEVDELLVQHPGEDSVDGWYRTLKQNKFELSRRSGDNTYLDWWCPEHFCRGEILVYQCGKVGSSTIVNSLAALGIGATHVHMLTDRFIYDLIPELAWQPDAAQASLIAASSRLCIDRIRDQKALKIITLVREPLSRNFSSFVYHLENLKASGYAKPGSSLDRLCANGMERRATQNGKAANGYEFDWFDGELNAVFGVDVYASPFDTAQGYALIRHDNIEILVLKLERLAELEAVIGQFVGATDFRLINANQSINKDYYDLYKTLRESVRLSANLVELYYKDNPCMNHFYSKAEQAAFIRSWRANLRQDGIQAVAP